MFDLVAGLLASFYELIPNYAFAIVMLTLVVMLALTPFTLKSMRSMARMAKLNPEMQALRKKYPDPADRMKLNEELMALYKENQVNPVSGCLPMLLQMPVFLVMYQVISGLGKNPPKYLDETTELYQALVAAGGKMVTFGIDLAKSAYGGHHSSIFAALPFYVLILAMVAANWFQTYQMNKRNPGAASAPGAAVIQRVFPIMFGLFSLQMPAGLVVYWLAQSLFRIAQQWAIFRFDHTTHREPLSAGSKVVDTSARAKDKPKDRAKDRPKDRTSEAKRPPRPITTGRVTPSGGNQPRHRKRTKKR